MSFDRQIGAAVGGSLLVHLLLAAGGATMLAFHRASAPENDDFSRGELLRGELEAAAFGDNGYATREAGEPAHSGTTGGGSVWWRWRSPDRQCGVELQVVGGGFEEVVAVYRGAVLETLIEVASRGAGDGAAIRFTAEPDTEYHIAIAGDGDGASGEIELRLRVEAEQETEHEEIVMLLPEMLEFTPAETREEDPAFSRSEGEGESERPEDARLQSDRNRSAAGELPPDEKGADDRGTQEGEDLPFAPAAFEVTPLWQTDAGASPSADGFTPVPEIDIVTEDSPAVAEASASAFETEATTDVDLPLVASANDQRPATPSPGAGEPSPGGGRQPPAPKARTIGKADAGDSASAATAETALGKYQAEIDRGVRSSSQRARDAHGTFEGTGFLKVRLWVNREGRVVNTTVLFSDATPEMVDVSVRGLRLAELPPMPDEVYRAAPDGLVDMVYDIFF